MDFKVRSAIKPAQKPTPTKNQVGIFAGPYSLRHGYLEGSLSGSDACLAELVCTSIAVEGG